MHVMHQRADEGSIWQACQLKTILSQHENLLAASACLSRAAGPFLSMIQLMLIPTGASN